MGKRVALLVGIDLYLSDGARKTDEGTPVTVNNLQGCANDVAVIDGCLQKDFRFDERRFLTSSMSASDPKMPRERQDRWPTFRNIEKEFFDIYEHVSPGDLFFFHFSGHGKRLRTSAVPSLARDTEPALLPMDFCCGQPAIRGWQLNEWLKLFNRKGARVVVSLDSCYSGSWRNNEACRTPKDWTLLPNLPIDVAALEGVSIERDARDGELEISWDINPDGFTLMAACESHQPAYEQRVDKITYGAFTYALWSHVREKSVTGIMPMYRDIRDHVASRIVPQNPQVFGRDRLAFFEAAELFAAAPLLAKIHDCTGSLAIGKVHGVKIGAEFIARRPTADDIILSIDQISDFESIASIKEGCLQPSQEYIEVVPFRWSSEGTLAVYIDSKLGRRFHDALRRSLEYQIAGHLQVIEESDLALNSSPGNAEIIELHVKSRLEDDRINIYGPPSVVGYEGPLRGLQIDRKNADDGARESAVFLTHLFRFAQVINLESDNIQYEGPFEISISPRSGPSQSILEDGQILEYVFFNQDSEELCFTVINLTPGFRVRQLFPSEDLAECVMPGGMCTFAFRVSLPEKLRVISNQEELTHRDIFRTVVTRGKRLSFKSLELPNIWDAGLMNTGERSRTGRNAFLASDFSWWIVDTQAHIRAREGI